MTVIWALLGIYVLWQLVLMLAGLIGLVTGWNQVEKGQVHRTVVFIPAHNEAESVARTVLSVIDAGGWPVVLADACDDDTVYRAHGAGARVIAGKWHSKARALNAVLGDAGIVCDSDGFRWAESFGVVDCGTVLKDDALRYTWAGRGRVVQLALGSATGRRSLLGAWYVWNYGLYHVQAVGRQLFGWSGWLGGSAMFWPVEMPIRFDSRGLTEDMDLSFHLHRVGIPIVYVATVRAVDEKPTGWNVAIPQLLRWTRGGWWCLLHGRFVSWFADDWLMAFSNVVNLVAGALLLMAVVVAPIQAAAWLLLYFLVGLVGEIFLQNEKDVNILVVAMLPVMGLIQMALSWYGLMSYNVKVWARTPHSIHQA